ncbi:uncharacterized protein LOC129953168 [Eupeodes corollae]|uniref:uncharacterized protein LOC129953168 n=1 Tax=Eupeodes corollae TaxID=290404 RepID=UPI0024912CA7|nr:uncharacterized protein LOC129953168 [Eupeodes corollae]XP_055922010.1 uncharacterized protein LOC129953168 [Eupeodes corollae]
MPKSQLHTDPANPKVHPNDGNEKPRSRWDIWVAKNALPKNRYFPQPKPKPTRFQKPGPMSSEAKKKFLKWAKKRTLPKCDCPKQTTKSIKSKATRKKSFKPRKIRRKVIFKMCRTQNLSVPKWPREKYIPPPPPNYPYSPKIHYRKPPHRDKGRPFQNVKLPHWWYHEELELDFWRWMRFPICRSALKYKINLNTRRMAISKAYPIKPHCPYPPRDYSPPDRVRMKPKQWRDHLKRLHYLADASFKETRQFRVKL